MSCGCGPLASYLCSIKAQTNIEHEGRKELESSSCVCVCVMPGKKRKAESASQNMWGSSSSPTSPSRRNNKQSSSSRRGGGGASGGSSGAYQRINEDSASKLFDEICDEDDPNVAGMEGECVNVLSVLCCCHYYLYPSLKYYIVYTTKIIVRNLQTMRATPTRPPRGCPCPRPTTQTRCEQKACRNFSGGMDVGL